MKTPDFRKHFLENPGHVHHVGTYFVGERCATCGETSEEFRVLPKATGEQIEFLSQVTKNGGDGA